MTGKARYLEADRAQLSWDSVDLESQLASDHRARVVWAFVERLDLSALYERIRAREGEPGRPPPDPRIFLALWLYATLEGVGSARGSAVRERYGLSLAARRGGDELPRPERLSGWARGCPGPSSDG